MTEAVCGLCGRERRPESLTCPRCFEDYRKQALKKGGNTNLLDWATQRAQARMPEVNAQRSSLKDLKAKLHTLDQEVGDETTLRLREMLGGERVSQNKWREMWAELRRQVWQEKGGNALYAQTRQLEADVAPLSAVDDLLAEIARRKKAQEADQTAGRLIDQALSPEQRGQ